MRVATALGVALPPAGATGAGGAGRASGARGAVSPARVSPTANAGPLPPSVVDSRLRPTTRTGAFGCAGAGGGVVLVGFTGSGLSTGGGGLMASPTSGGGGRRGSAPPAPRPRFVAPPRHG